MRPPTTRRGTPTEDEQRPSPTDVGEALTELVLATLRAHSELMDVARRLSARGGITPAQWQVLGSVLDEPRTVSEVARGMGMSRQAVQRVSDWLVEHDLADYLPNPSHRRAKLLAPTNDGAQAIHQIALAQRPWSHRVGSQLGIEDLNGATEVLTRLADVLADGPDLDDQAAPPR